MLFFPKEITVWRQTGMFIEGEWTIVGYLLDLDGEMLLDLDGQGLQVGDVSQDILTIKGSVQPITGKDTDSLPVGRSDIGRVKVYTSTKLQIGLSGSENSGDIIIFDGRKWEIVQENTYNNSILNHFKYIAEYRGEAA